MGVTGMDPLEQVLELVADGRLTAEEAAPILAALDAPAERPLRAAGPPPDAAADLPPFGAPSEQGTASALRIEVRDGGRQVVNLRLPLAVGRFALDRVPGLSSEAADRVRDALRVGMLGPVLEVDEGEGSGVRIVLE